jgi:26S proteasome regulatory subunit N8
MQFLLWNHAVCSVPFEEDDKDSSIWFLDHSYLENMFRMFKKVNGECWHVIAWHCVA